MIPSGARSESKISSPQQVLAARPRKAGYAATAPRPARPCGRTQDPRHSSRRNHCPSAAAAEAEAEVRQCERTRCGCVGVLTEVVDGHCLRLLAEFTWRPGNPRYLVERASVPPDLNVGERGVARQPVSIDHQVARSYRLAACPRGDPQR